MTREEKRLKDLLKSIRARRDKDLALWEAARQEHPYSRNRTGYTQGAQAWRDPSGHGPKFRNSRGDLFLDT